MTKEQIQKLYPNNKDPNFDKVNEELERFDDTEEAKKQDEEIYGR